MWIEAQSGDLINLDHTIAIVRRGNRVIAHLPGRYVTVTLGTYATNKGAECALERLWESLWRDVRYHAMLRPYKGDDN